MFDLAAIQKALADFQFDGWLLYDFRNSNILARRVLDIPDEAVGSRRFFYFIPQSGEPKKLVHRIEDDALDHLPGEKNVYLKWQELEVGLEQMVASSKTVAMEYSPRNANPYVSKVDAGTVELVRSFGAEVASSGDLIQLFEATLDDDQWQMHLEVSEHTNSAFAVAWKFIADGVRANGSVEESDVRAAIMDHFATHKMTTYHAPIVGVGPNSGLPHYETGTGENTTIRENDFVLVDLWAKFDRPRAIYSDLTRTGFVGETVPQKYIDIFNIVAAARDAGIDCARQAFAEGRKLRGYEVDRATRAVIHEAGYGEFFRHRTGHNMAQETHGNGAHMDDLETHEDRRVMPRTLFTIEPGIYLPEFGVRSEVDVFIDENGGVHVTGGELQTEIVPILRDF